MFPVMPLAALQGKHFDLRGDLRVTFEQGTGPLTVVVRRERMHCSKMAARMIGSMPLLRSLCAVLNCET